MKLEKFDNQKKQRNIFIFTFVILFIGISIGIVIHKTYASFQETKKFNVIEGTVKYEGSGDVTIAAYIDGVKTNTFPSKIDYTYDEEQSNCTNEAVLNFDIVSWIGSVSNVIKPNTKCNLYFNSRPVYENQIYQTMVRLEEEDNTQLAYDNTKGESNIRYIGANPNNYVTFNGELWRIIGSFKDIDDGTGRKEWRTKIIKTASLGNMAWDTDSANGGNGINEWSTSDIKTYLNDTYYPGLTQESKDMIGDTVWNLGTNGNVSYYTATPDIFYGYERSNNTGKICSSGTYCNDTVPRTTTWRGKIGLMYPSDYGFAIGESERILCLNTALGDWLNKPECRSSDWLFNSDYQWTITPATESSHAARVFRVMPDGGVYYDAANAIYGVRPSLYLSSNVQITSGSGASIDPYILSVQ